MYQILSTNAAKLSEQGLELKTHEISVAVLTEDLKKGVENPTFYAFRYGMYYDPTGGEFKPNLTGKQKLKDYHIESYYQQLPIAREEYRQLLEVYKAAKNGGGGDVSETVAKLQNELAQKNTRIREQAQKIADMAANGSGGGGQAQIDQLEKMIKTLSEMKSNRIEIAIQGKATKIIEKATHEKFEKIVRLVARKQAVYLYGPAGTGKSELAKQVAEALELDFYPASTVTQEFKLTGFEDGNGNFHDTNFYKAFKFGGIFFLDEMDSCSPEVLVGLNGALANGYFDFPHETIQAHENFRVIAAGNTIGRGGDMSYTGRSTLDISTLDRFWALKIDYSLEIEKAVAKGDMELVEFAHEIRRAAEETGIIILMSYRSISRIADFQDDFDLVEIMEMAVIKGIAEDDVQMLVRNMSAMNSNKYFKALKKAA